MKKYEKPVVTKKKEKTGGTVVEPQCRCSGSSTHVNLPF